MRQPPAQPLAILNRAFGDLAGRLLSAQERIARYRAPDGDLNAPTRLLNRTAAERALEVLFEEGFARGARGGPAAYGFREFGGGPKKAGETKGRRNVARPLEKQPRPKGAPAGWMQGGDDSRQA